MSTPTTTTIGVYADTRRRGTCNGAHCSAALTWAEVAKSGKRMCFTGDPVALRTEHDAGGRLIEHLDFADNHWATCPDAKGFKRKAAR